MKITSAQFVCSNTEYKKCPEKKIHEYAFIGRSNVGKSSLINLLTGQKDLAKTSSKPGKTQLINHFIINEQRNPWYLVDLPGYGYAKVAKSIKNTWQKFITDYISYRNNLLCLFVLIDSRHEPQKIDLEFMDWLGNNEIPFVIAFTKSDKMTPRVLTENINKYLSILGQTWDETPTYFITSVTLKTGKEEILSFIEQTNNSVKLV
jgi:GTP-binding protein